MKPSKTTLVALLVISIAAGYWLAQAGTLEPPGPPAPTGRSTIFQADIPLTITAPGSYVVMESLTGVSGQHGITIDADDVTIDLNGFSLEGVAGSLDGVHVASTVEGVVVEHGTIRDWGEDGIDAADANASVIRDVRALANTGVGMRVGSTSPSPEHRRSLVIECTANDNGSDGMLLGDDTLVFRSIAAINGGAGIVLNGRSIADSCLTHLNDGDGIEGASSGLAIRNSESSNNSGAGIRVVSRALVMGCSVHGNGGGAIVQSGGDNLLVDNNTT